MVSPPKPSLPQFLVNPPESSAMVFPEDFFFVGNLKAQQIFVAKSQPQRGGGGGGFVVFQISTTRVEVFFCGVPNQKIVPPKKMLKNLTSFHFGIFRIPCKKNNGGWLNLSICTNFVGW